MQQNARRKREGRAASKATFTLKKKQEKNNMILFSSLLSLSLPPQAMFSPLVPPPPFQYGEYREDFLG